MIKGYLYRLTMKVSHHFNWHYAPPVYPDGDTQLWCKWCGFRQTVKRRTKSYSWGYIHSELMKSREATRGKPND